MLLPKENKLMEKLEKIPADKLRLILLEVADYGWSNDLYYEIEALADEKIASIQSEVINENL